MILNAIEKLLRVIPSQFLAARDLLIREKRVIEYAR